MNTPNTSPKGTYVGLRVLPPSNKQITAFCLDNGIAIDKSRFEQRLHTTVIYSRIHVPTIEIFPNTRYVGAFAGFDLFSGQAGENVLVMKLNCAELSARHKFIMDTYGTSYDFPDYTPHITLSYKYPDKTLLGLVPFKEPILLGMEYTEDLELNWS